MHLCFISIVYAWNFLFLQHSYNEKDPSLIQLESFFPDTLNVSKIIPSQAEEPSDTLANFSSDLITSAFYRYNEKPCHVQKTFALLQRIYFQIKRNQKF